MEDVLETKYSSFLVDYLYLIHIKSRIKKNNKKIRRKTQLLILEVNKVEMIKPESGKSTLGVYMASFGHVVQVDANYLG